jgi:hypothetical protein
MSEQPVVTVEKPKRKYTKKIAPDTQSSARELLKEIVSEINASKEQFGGAKLQFCEIPPTPPAPKKKRVLSAKQLECMAKGLELRLAKLKSVSVEK